MIEKGLNDQDEGELVEVGEVCFVGVASAAARGVAEDPAAPEPVRAEPDLEMESLPSV